MRWPHWRSLRIGRRPVNRRMAIRRCVRCSRIAARKSPQHPAIRQNPNLQGWSWTDGTFSWVEPTAWCMLAVKKLARSTPEAGARVAEAEKVLEDRACSGGGWNYGNPEVYGKSLLAHVPPTAAGVLALQNRRERTDRAAGRLAFSSARAAREGSTTAHVARVARVSRRASARRSVRDEVDRAAARRGVDRKSGVDVDDALRPRPARTATRCQRP